ncbi:hypothetical protein KZ813_16975 [Sphingomonas sp. RHCKR7]|uniref:hypothetical protein n=1 Tax=Sphingomonas folli TaxID=2862497 RepID=UPI001CA4E178|nr:hypothetical protein [Sphingomonas folli]MBW6528538.1 hypothetical protein [Sphingomonas folli]
MATVVGEMEAGWGEDASEAVVIDLELVADLTTDVAASEGERRRLFDFLLGKAMLGKGISYKGDRACYSRICEQAKIPRGWRNRKHVDIIEKYGPRFKPSRYVYRNAMRDALPDIPQRGVAVPTRKLVAEMERAAAAMKEGAPLTVIRHLVKVAQGDRTLPQWNGGPNKREIMRQSGADKAAVIKLTACHEVITAWAGFFRLADMLTKNRNGTVVTQRVGHIAVAEYIAGLKGEKPPRKLYANKRGGVSYVALSAETNLPHTTVTNKACKDLAEADVAARGLGPVWKGKSRAERDAIAARRDELMEHVKKCVTAGIPLPAKSTRRDSIDFDELVRRSGKPGPSLAEDIQFKRLIWKAGAKVAPLDEPAMDLYDYDYLIQTAPSERSAHLSGNSKSSFKTTTKKAIQLIRDYVAERDGLPRGENRLVRDDFGTTGEEFEMLLDAMLEDDACGRTPSTFLGAARWVRNWLIERREDDGLGDEFHAALAEALERDGRLPEVVAQKAGVNLEKLRSWIEGEHWPKRGDRKVISALESVLELKDTRLTEILDRDDSWQRAARHARRLPRRCGPHAADNWRQMDEAEFLAMIDFISTRLLQRDTAHGAAMRESAARRVSEEIRRQELGEDLGRISETLEEELAYLADHMTKPFGTDLLRRGGKRWRENTTAPMRLSSLVQFLRWQIKPKSAGGLGRDPAHLTIADLIHPPLVFAYIDHKAGELADVEWEGRKRGKVFTATQVDFLRTSAALVAQDFGFITQQFDLAGRIVPDARALPTYAYIDDEGRTFDDDEEEDAPADSGVPIMPGHLASLNSSEFLTSMRAAELRYRQAGDDLDLIADSTRDPMESISVVLDSEEPLELILRHLALGAEREPNKARDPLAWHTHWRNVLVNDLFALTSLRSTNVREIMIDGPTPNLVFDNERGMWMLQIHWRQFKNFRSAPLFGRKRNREYYRKYLPDYGGLYEKIDKVKNECRPYFLNRLATGLAVPNEFFLQTSGVPIPKSDMWRLVFKHTALHVAGNPYRGTGIINCQPFGPHAYRDIRATDILLHPTDGKDPYLEAAMALQTSRRMIQDHYGRVRSEVRNAEADLRFLKVYGRVAAQLGLHA